jgi:hypothetical protein
MTAKADNQIPPNPGPLESLGENRTIVTPYAFGVAPALLGKPLATPFRRLVAILLDLLLIAILAGTPSLVLALLSAWVSWRAAGKYQPQSGLRRLPFYVMRLTATLLLFLGALSLYERIGSGDDDSIAEVNGETISPQTGLQLAAISVRYVGRADDLITQIENGTCGVAMDCWTALMQEMGQDLGNTRLSQSVATGLLKSIAGKAVTQLTQVQIDEITTAGVQAWTTVAPPVLTQLPAQTADFVADSIQSDMAEINRPAGIMELLGNLAQDLGLGFGWAAFYFTVFGAWWRGQTPGKRLLKIRIVRLNGADMNLWESFGRYAGYCAGLATGLLGFLQIYWDPNRQAIQDKISETLVLDLRPKPAHAKANS